jgi:hypothetical protein
MPQFHVGMDLCLSLQECSTKFIAPQGYLYFPCFSNAFSLGANKKDLLHVTYCILSLLPFG